MCGNFMSDLFRSLRKKAFKIFYCILFTGSAKTLTHKKPSVRRITEIILMFKKYRLNFDIWGLMLFLVIMTPNFIWFAVPAPNDVLRTDSVTEILDAIASVCQVFMAAALCLLKNRESRKMRLSPLITAVIVCCLLYFASWIIYYTRAVNPLVISGLTVSPCAAFLFFAIDRKNKPAVVPILIFTVCHIIYAAVNFII